MDVTVKKTGIPIKRTMVLEDEARPAQLRSCNPWGECKFSLQMRKGGLVRVYDSVLVSKHLMILQYIEHDIARVERKFFCFIFIK